MEPKVPRRERERLRHRQEILEAARKVLAERGLEGMTVEVVAKEADFAVGSIYRHFRSKEELIALMAVDLAEPALEELEAITASDEPFAVVLDAFVRTRQRHAEEDAPVFKLLFLTPGALPAPNSPETAPLRQVMERYLAVVDALIAAGQAQGALAAGDRLPMTLTFMGIESSFSKWALFHELPVQGDVAALIQRAFLDGCRARGVE